MKINLEKKSPIQFKVDAEISWEEINNKILELYRRFQKTARIRGFRPGKAPIKLIQEFYGSLIQKEVVESIIESSFEQIVSEHNFTIYNSYDWQMGKFKENEPFKYTVFIEVNPQFDEIKYKGLEIEKIPEPPPMDELIEQSLNQLQNQHSRLEPLTEPRGIKKGDIININYEIFMAGEVVSETRKEKTEIEVGVPFFFKDDEEIILKALEGHKQGEKVKVDITFPKDYGYEKIAGKKAVIFIEVLDIKNKIIPKIDDDFAKDLGEKDISNLNDLKEHLKQKILLRIEVERKWQYKERILNLLISENNFSIPSSLVDKNVEHSKKYFSPKLREIWTKNIGEDGMNKIMREEAEKKIKIHFLLDEIIKREQLIISDKEIEGYLKEEAQNNGEPLSKYKGMFLHNEEEKEMLIEILQETKVMELILKEAKIVDKDIQIIEQKEKHKSSKNVEKESITEAQMCDTKVEKIEDKVETKKRTTKKKTEEIKETDDMKNKKKTAKKVQK